jgi:hypothetical protein
VAVAALAALAAGADHLSRTTAAAILMVAGLGLGPFFPSSTVAAQNAVERGHLGAVSGAVAFSRALGGAIGVAAASALVLGIVAQAIAQSGQIASLEDLARQTLPAEARIAVARAFAVMFAATAATLLAGLAIFLRVENRQLGDRPAAGRAAE